MKYFSILLTLIATHLQAQTFTGDTWAFARRNGSATIVLTHAEVPNYSEMKNNRPSGICFEIMDHFIEFVDARYGIKVEVKYRSVDDPTNFQAFLKAVQNSKGGVFGLGDVSITPDRRELFEFTPPYLSNVAILVTSKSVTPLSDLSNIGSEFKGMKAAVQQGSSHDKRVTALQEKYGGVQIEYVSNSSQKLEKVTSSDRYFTYIDFPNYVDAVLDGVNIKRHAAGDDAGGKFGLIMPKGSDWSPIMNAFFRANGGYTLSEKYRESLKRNLGEKILRLTDAFANAD
ncbi:MAG: transporter substrate-binding domain-containing protein [Bacteroidota bacterium]